MPCQSDFLTQFEPINGLIITATRYLDGWSLQIRHRHLAGLFTDCDNELFVQLDLEELTQTIEGVVHALGAVPGPRPTHTPRPTEE